MNAWVLGSLIDVACEVNVLGKDVKDFSAKVRDFRNYIHPNEQIKQAFSPTMSTVEISLKVFNVAVSQVREFIDANPIN